jgi:hypothetical protein
VGPETAPHWKIAPIGGECILPGWRRGVSSSTPAAPRFAFTRFHPPARRARRYETASILAGSSAPKLSGPLGPDSRRGGADLAALTFAAPLASAAESEPGFKPLFNGRDLTGWDGMPDTGKVEDGAIVSGGSTKNWLIYRGAEFADFELRLSFKFTSDNSGVQIRSEDLDGHQVCGVQVEVASRAFQEHGRKCGVALKNIRIKPLPL